MYAKKNYKPSFGNGGKDTEMIMKMQEGGRMRKRRVATMQELKPISPRLITQREYYNPLPENDYRNDPYFRRPRMAFDAEQYSGRAGYGKTAAEKEANIDRKIIDENRSMLLSGRGLEPMMYMVDKYMKGGTVKYRSGGMMEYENGGEVSREPKIDYVPNQVQTRGRIVKEQAPGQRPRIKEEGVGYEDEGIFYIDGVPATYEDAKRAFEQTSDFGVGSSFDDYLTKYKKQQGAYNVGLSPQREALRSRSESAGTERLLQALRDMQLAGLGI